MSRSFSTMPTEMRQYALLTTVLGSRGSVVRRANGQDCNIYHALERLFGEAVCPYYAQPGDDDYDPKIEEGPQIWQFRPEEYGDSELKLTLKALLATSRSVLEDMRWVLDQLEARKTEEMLRWTAHVDIRCQNEESLHESSVALEALGLFPQESYDNMELTLGMENQVIHGMIRDLKLDLDVIAEAKQTLMARLQIEGETPKPSYPAQLHLLD